MSGDGWLIHDRVHIMHGLGKQFLARVSRHPTIGLVDLDDPSLSIHPAKAIHGGLQDLAVAGLTRPQLGLGSLLLLNAPRRKIDMRLPFQIKNRRRNQDRHGKFPPTKKNRLHATHLPMGVEVVV